ncbi:hypothetical protein A79_1208 [Vibrio parahaemolyticus AQ3810]|nr:hypothetical protein A79_1208 [Vibrio parahaemolyticus AQ3810]
MRDRTALFYNQIDSKINSSSFITKSDGSIVWVCPDFRG